MFRSLRISGAVGLLIILPLGIPRAFAVESGKEGSAEATPPASPPAPGPDSAPAPAPAPPNAQLVDGVAAIVGRDVILVSDVEERLRFAVAQLSPADRDTLDLARLRNQILESMIDDNLLVAEATHAGVEVTTGEVTDGVEKAVARVRVNFPNEAAFEQELASEGLDISTLRQNYREIVRRQLLGQRVIQKEIYSRVQVKDDEVRAWYHEHQDEIPDVPARVVIDHILIVPRPAAAAETAADGKLDEIRRHLAAGENFADVARKYSEAPGAERGGSMGMFAKGDLDPAFAAAESVAFTLKVGEVSAPVRTPLGLHLIHLDERNGDRVRASQILVRLQATAADSAEARTRAERVAAEARKGRPFEELASENSDDRASAAAGGRLGAVALDQLPPLFRKPLETAAAGDIIGPLDSPSGLEIVHLVSRDGARKPGFDEVAPDVKQNLIETRARDQYEGWIADLRQKSYIKILRTGSGRG